MFGSNYVIGNEVCVCPALLQRVLQTNEENSSPSHMNSAKGSSIYLHWNYTYIGDGTHGIVTTKYKEQVLGFKVSPNSNIYVLAKRIGQNGAVTLQSPLPTPFNGRVQVISSNSSLVVHNLQYNDSKYQLSSAVIVNVNFGAGPKENKYNLKPIVSVSVYGIPEFTILPPKTLDVNEYSDLHVLIGMDGSPKPSADFRWSHLPPSSKSNITSVQLYPFVYSSTYTLKNIDASYCGRILQTTLKNSIGSSSVTASTNVTVSLKLDKPINMTVKKLPKPGCLEVRWNQVDSGACNVRYDVVWKTASRGRMANRSGYNIDKMTICDVKTGTEIISAQLIVRFRNTVKHLDITISEEPMTTAPPIKADSNTSLIVGSVVGVLLAVLGIIILFIWCYKKFKSRCHLLSSKGNGRPPRGNEMQSGPSIVRYL